MIEQRNACGCLKYDDNVKKLYKKAFPKNERIPFPVLHLIALWKKTDFTSYYKNGTFCGLSYSFIFSDFVYLFFLAVDENMRGTGLGSEILDIIKKKYDGKCIVLNAEVPDDKADNSRQRVSRIKFYEKNGFKDAECGYKDISGEYVTLYSGYEFPYGSFCLICNSYPAKFYGTKAGY